MSYTAAWTNADAQGRIRPSLHRVRVCDPLEIGDAINRRRRLTYQNPQDFSSIAPGDRVGADAIVGSPAAFSSLRYNIAARLVNAPAGVIFGSPASPLSMQWLWPENDGDENKVLVTGTAQSGQVNLFGKLNQGTDWTDPALSDGDEPIRAVHVNELRQSLEWLRRGRWVLPCYFPCGLLSVMPDTPWAGGAVGNNGQDEWHCAGFAIVRALDDPSLGLSGATVRSCAMEITADCDCTLEVYRLQNAIDCFDDLPTWNQASSSRSWGDGGVGDGVLIGSITLTANTPGMLSADAAMQAVIDGAPQYFLMRRSDTSYDTAQFSAYFHVDFDLNSPPT